MAKYKTLLFLSALLVLCLCVAGQVSALTFEDVSKESGAADKGRGKEVAFADIDGDGDYDLFVSNKGGGSKLYRNDSTPGNILFTDISAVAGDNLGDVGFCTGSTFADVDNDGRPDLFIAKGGQYEIEANRLLLNESTPGRIHFRDVSVEAGINTKDFTYQAAFADYDNDGKLDLFLANYGVGVKNRLFRNETIGGKVRFTGVSQQAGVGARRPTRAVAAVPTGRLPRRCWATSRGRNSARTNRGNRSSSSPTHPTRRRSPPSKRMPTA